MGGYATYGPWSVTPAIVAAGWNSSQCKIKNVRTPAWKVTWPYVTICTALGLVIYLTCEHPPDPVIHTYVCTRQLLDSNMRGARSQRWIRVGSGLRLVAFWEIGTGQASVHYVCHIYLPSLFGSYIIKSKYDPEIMWRVRRITALAILVRCSLC